MANKQKGKSGRTLHPFSIEMRRRIAEMHEGQAFTAQDFYALAEEYGFSHRAILPSLRVWERLHNMIVQVMIEYNSQGRPHPVFAKVGSVVEPVLKPRSMWEI